MFSPNNNVKFAKEKRLDFNAKWHKQAGIGKITFLVFGTIIFVTSYCAYYILPFYYYYYELLNQMDAVIRVASTESDEEIRNKLWEQVKIMGIPAEKEEIIIMRFNERMRISLDYEEEFYIHYKGEDHTIHVFEFNAEVERGY